MKLLINSSDCILDSNFEFNIKTNVDISNFSSCILEYINIPITWNNINETNNIIRLVENTIVTVIYLPVAQYKNFNQISSQLMISLNIYSTNKDYIVNYNQQTSTYQIKSNSVFSIKFNTILSRIFGISDLEYVNVTRVESTKKADLTYDNFFINMDFLQPEIINRRHIMYNFIIPIEKINENLVNQYYFKYNINEIRKISNYLQNIRIIFYDNYSVKIYAHHFSILLKFN